MEKSSIIKRRSYKSSKTSCINIYSNCNICSYCRSKRQGRPVGECRIRRSQGSTRTFGGKDSKIAIAHSQRKTFGRDKDRHLQGIVAFQGRVYQPCTQKDNDLRVSSRERSKHQGRQTLNHLTDSQRIARQEGRRHSRNRSSGRHNEAANNENNKRITMASIFTKIIDGEIPSYKVAEDDNMLCFLTCTLAEGTFRCTKQRLITFRHETNCSLTHAFAKGGKSNQAKKYMRRNSVAV